MLDVADDKPTTLGFCGAPTCRAWEFTWSDSLDTDLANATIFLRCVATRWLVGSGWDGSIVFFGTQQFYSIRSKRYAVALFPHRQPLRTAVCVSAYARHAFRRHAQLHPHVVRLSHDSVARVCAVPMHRNTVARRRMVPTLFGDGDSVSACLVAVEYRANMGDVVLELINDQARVCGELSLIQTWNAVCFRHSRCGDVEARWPVVLSVRTWELRTCVLLM